MEYLAEHLRYLRLSRNWSQKQMAALMGVKQPTYCKIENCKQEATLSQLRLVCDDFDLELFDLLEMAKTLPFKK